MGAVSESIKINQLIPPEGQREDKIRGIINQNIQNEEPLAFLSNRIHQNFKQSVIASKNIMDQQPRFIRPKLDSMLDRSSQKDSSLDFTKISEKMSQELILPVFEVLSRIKVKKPTFQMIQIDHKKFLRMKITPISDDYELFNEIGKGGFGSVFKAKDRKTNEVRAIKKINKSSLTPEEKSSLVNEFDILSSLDHPNIIKLYDIYDDQNDLYVVTELCEGGDLLRFVNSRKITEKIMRTVMVQLISAVKYMHNFKILHRDIKLENIVLVKNITHEKQKIEIKLIDFGISLNLDKVKPSTEFDPIGTLLYMSPESINGHASLSADIWSCGIALYMMCTRKLPFNFKNDTELVHRIKKGQIVRNHLQKLSLDLKVFVMQLLETNYANRITAPKAIHNAWLKKQAPKSELSVSTRMKAAKSLLDYDAKNNLVSIIEAYLIYKKVNQQERQRMASIFEDIDEDKSGVIQIEELKKFYSENSEHYDAKDVEELLKVMDKNRSGRIDFNQFITAMCDRRVLFQLQALEQAFDYFDKDKSGEISKGELQGILEGVQHEEIEYLFSELDKNHDFKISKKEFMAYLCKYQ